VPVGLRMQKGFVVTGNVRCVHQINVEPSLNSNGQLPLGARLGSHRKSPVFALESTPERKISDLIPTIGSS